MIEKQDRRSFLKTAAATSALGAVGTPPAQAAACQDEKKKDANLDESVLFS